MIYLANFFAAAFLCNSLPHLLCGLQGTPFPSPFAKPPGKGDSSPLVNFLWGTFNLFIGALLLSRNPIDLGLNLNFAVFSAGFLLMGIQLSLHFGSVQKSRMAK